MRRGRWRQSAMVLLLALILATAFFSLKWILLHANELGRQCRRPLDRRRRLKEEELHLTFGIVSCSDNLSSVPHRSFEGIMELVSPNKLRYAQRHGYTFIDASHLLDPHRPPSWSKIKAVAAHLQRFDWVFWNDADSLVTNFDVTLEDVLEPILGDGGMQELIITEDVTGVNAGMFFIRDSSWSRAFLSRWWNQTGFIKPFGESKSGDNDALKHLVRTMNPEEMKQHILIAPMQCSFNSYLWIPSWKNIYRLVTLPRFVWGGTYSVGDFMVHLAGVDDKSHWIQKFVNQEKPLEL